MRTWIINQIKKWFRLFDQQDIENALCRIDKADDRAEFEWKLMVQLAGIQVERWR